MSISDKNRKILWGKSGNLCAICRQALVIDPTTADPESVVGDECHIISGAKGGPRHTPEFPIDEIDSLSNLMLLCRKRPGNYTYLLKFHGNRLSISGAGWHSSLRQAMM
ncbi:HNH endonuclease [Shewanella profunda]|uniref:HNH endonuclease n=1 Tax=Shewanella profunda TaxID=254793 RepID=UPI00200FCF15|nr:HNH endonuclease signature motif containing protein [Shewanella profunda]MCL1092103.1 HNH endonuclease [Shewanella profunda]